MSAKIMIADNHSMFREGLKSILESDGSLEVIAEAKDGEECLEVLKNENPELLLLDIKMPKQTGFQVLDSMKKKGNTTPVLILTASNEIEYLMHALDIGVDGYLLKDCDSKELKKAIFTILDGKTYIQPNLIPMLNQKTKSREEDSIKIESLTERETEVLKLVSNGMYNKEIAEKLQISEHTVKNHLFNIFKKIDVTDRTQAALFAIRNHMININFS